jgi:hypothetical protein
VWFDAPTVDRLRRMHEVMKKQRAAYPGGTGMLDLIVDGTPRFSGDVRDEAIKITGDGKDVGAAHVILFTGLRGVATRTFLSTMLLVGRPATPTKVFDGVAAAASWLAPLLSVGGVQWTADAIGALEAPAISPARPAKAQ